MSFLEQDPDALELLQHFARMRHAHGASGASLYGPNLSQWPNWAVEVLGLLENERVIAENARIRTENREE